jgi:hypothetical protein
MGEAGQSPALSRNCSSGGLYRPLESEYPPLLAHDNLFAERGWCIEVSRAQTALPQQT